MRSPLRPTLRQVEYAAMQLTREERELLARKLLRSLDEDARSATENAWIEEAVRRRDELDGDPSFGISAKQFHDELKKEFGWS